MLPVGTKVIVINGETLIPDNTVTEIQGYESGCYHVVDPRGNGHTATNLFRKNGWWISTSFVKPLSIFLTKEEIELVEIKNRWVI